MNTTKRLYNQPGFVDEADITKISDNFDIDELNLDAINGVEWGGYIELGTEIISVGKVYIDKRNGKQYKIFNISAGSTFDTCQKFEYNLVQTGWGGIIIGSTTTSTDIHSINIPGFYKSEIVANIFTNLPPGCDSAFNMQVMSISALGNYTRQIVYEWDTNKIWSSLITDTGATWSEWERIDAGGVPSGTPSVGSVIFRADSTNPGTIYLGTTWERIAVNRNIRGAADGELGGETGGSDTVTISQANLPNTILTSTAHNHTFTGTEHTHQVIDCNGGGGSYGTGYWTYGEPGSPNAAQETQSVKSATAGGTISSDSVTVPLGGSGTALTVTNAFYKIHIWKRLT